MTHHALFIANNEYADQALRRLDGAERDAEELYGLFKRELGYEAEPLYSPSPDQVQAAVLALGRRVHAGDTVLFYFAGHGAERNDGKDQYLLLKHAQLRQLRDGYAAPAGVVSVNDLLRETDDWPDVARVFIFDACRVPLAASRSTAGTTPVFGSERLLNELAAARGSVYRTRPRRAGDDASSEGTATQKADAPLALPPVFIKACLSKQEAREIPGLQRGVFSMALEDAIQAAKRLSHAVLTEAGLLGEVRLRMQQTAQRHGLPADQTPWMNDGAPEVLLFRPPRVAATPPPPAPTPAPAPALPVASSAVSDKGLSELVDAFERQLAAGQLDWPDDDCCVATLALMPQARMGEAGLARYRKLLREAREAKTSIAPPQPPTPPPKATPSPTPTPSHTSELASAKHESPRSKKPLMALGGLGALGLLAVLATGPFGKKEPPHASTGAPSPPAPAALESTGAPAAPASAALDAAGPLPHSPPAPIQATPQPSPPPADPYPNVDGLPNERLLALQREAAQRAGVGVEFSDRLRDGRAGPAMMVIPAGRFQMGSDSGDIDEKPPHVRKIDAFALMKTEVTVGQYLVCVAAGGCSEPEWREAGSKYHYQTGSDNLYRNVGAALTDENSPVVGVSWKNARQYAAWLKAQTGKDYRLASEAEWEYAARSGSTGRWGFGDDEKGSYARYYGNSQGRIWPVGGLKPNRWGLHDMHGNVWEWVQDCWHHNYAVAGRPATGVAWEANCSDSQRVTRGGSWYSIPWNLRLATRDGFAPGNRNYGTGFRIARTF